MRTLCVIACLALPLAAQGPDYKTNSSSARSYQKTISGYVAKAAEKMPESNYGYQPTPEVRTFGQLVGHVANANYNFCAASLGEANPNKGNIEKEKTSKADLTAALKASFEYCDKAYSALTEENGGEPKKMGNRGERTRHSLLTFNTMHMNEHYGNIVTYMRLKGIIPPSSER